MEKKYIEDIVVAMGKETTIFDYVENCSKSEENIVLSLKVKKHLSDMTEKEKGQRAISEIKKYFGETLENTFHLAKNQDLDKVVITLDDSKYLRRKKFGWACCFSIDYCLYSYNSDYEIWEYRCSISRDEKNEIISRMLNNGQISRFKGCFYKFEDSFYEESARKIVISETREIVFNDRTEGFLIISSSKRGVSFVDKLNSRYFYFDENSKKVINETAREVAYDIKKERILRKITKGQKLSLLREHFKAELCTYVKTGKKVEVEKVFVDEKQTMCILLSVGRHIVLYRNGKENPRYISIEEIAKKSVEFSFDEILKSFGKFDFLLKNLIFFEDFKNTISLKLSMYRDRVLELRARKLGNENFSWFEGFETIEKLALKRKKMRAISDRRFQCKKIIEKYGDRIFVKSEDGNKVGYGMIEYIIEYYRPSSNKYTDKIRADILYEEMKGSIHEGITLDIILDIINRSYPMFIL